MSVLQEGHNLIDLIWGHRHQSHHLIIVDSQSLSPPQNGCPSLPVGRESRRNPRVACAHRTVKLEEPRAAMHQGNRTVANAGWDHFFDQPSPGTDLDQLVYLWVTPREKEARVRAQTNSPLEASMVMVPPAQRSSVGAAIVLPGPTERKRSRTGAHWWPPLSPSLRAGHSSDVGTLPVVVAKAPRARTHVGPRPPRSREVSPPESGSDGPARDGPVRITSSS